MEDEIVPLHQPFDVALRGFDRHQVLDHIDSLKGHIDMVERDRDAALAHTAELRRMLEHLRTEGAVLTHLQRQVDAATEQMHRLQQSPIEGVPARIQQMLTLAAEEAAEMRGRAQVETDQLRSQVESETDQLRSQVESETAELRNRAASEAAALRDRARAESERLSRDTAARCERLEAATQCRRQEAEQRLEQEIAHRHAEATRQITEQEKTSLARMHLMMRAVGDQVDAARQEIESLTTLRAEIAAQLATADRLLAAAIEHVHDTGDPAREMPEPEPVPGQRLGSVVAG